MLHSTVRPGFLPIQSIEHEVEKDGFKSSCYLILKSSSPWSVRIPPPQTPRSIPLATCISGATILCITGKPASAMKKRESSCATWRQCDTRGTEEACKRRREKMIVPSAYLPNRHLWGVSRIMQGAPQRCGLPSLAS